MTPIFGDRDAHPARAEICEQQIGNVFSQFFQQMEMPRCKIVAQAVHDRGVIDRVVNVVAGARADGRRRSATRLQWSVVSLVLE